MIIPKGVRIFAAISEHNAGPDQPHEPDATVNANVEPIAPPQLCLIFAVADHLYLRGFADTIYHTRLCTGKAEPVVALITV